MLQKLLSAFRRSRLPSNPFQRPEQEGDVIINLYASCTNCSPLDFSHCLNGQRDIHDKGLKEHLNGFIGYIASRGDGKMSQHRYHVMRHVQKTHHHLSISVAPQDFSSVYAWARKNLAILFLEDGSVCNPDGQSLIDAHGVESTAKVPYAQDAIERKRTIEAGLRERGIPVLDALPPGLGIEESTLRSAQEVSGRLHAILAVAIYAEARRTGQDLSLYDLRQRMPLGIDALTLQEKAFLDKAQPEEKEINQFGWRYECAWVLAWALGLTDELAFPVDVCKPDILVKLVLDAAPGQPSHLRSTSEILDALDLHLRLNWALRQARQTQKAMPAKLEPGVVQERHFALNWLVRFEDADWDDVDTPT